MEKKCDKKNSHEMIKKVTWNVRGKNSCEIIKKSNMERKEKKWDKKLI